MTDLISRADAVKAIRKCKFESVMPSDWYRGMECAQDIVKTLPSAETHEIRTETHECIKGTHDTDLISRADAIAYIDRIISSGLGRNKSLDYIHKYISALPSANVIEFDFNKYQPRVRNKVNDGTLSADTSSDLISRADAIEAVRKELVCDGRHETHDKVCRFIADVLLTALPSKGGDAEYADLPDIPRYYYEKVVGKMAHEINMLKEQLESADTVPTVIRANTFMRKEDFDKWAEDIKKQNKSIVCIPCDAEVVSADAVQGEWTPFDRTFGRSIWCCSVCKTCTDVPCDAFTQKPIYDYCPNCGAKMKGGAE